MAKKLKTVSILVGKSTSEMPLRIPLSLREKDLSNFMTQLSLNDQIDIFCICEALDLHYNKQGNEGDEANAVREIIAFFSNEMNNPLFIQALQDRKLVLSVHRANLGRELCLYL